jgi:uncharacterized LabA/DUF88 family protein
VSAAWFIDGSFAYKCTRDMGRIDYAKFRAEIEDDAKEEIGDAYYFNCDNDPPSAAQSGFHKRLGVPAPDGAGLRVKLYWLQHKKLWWPDQLGGGPVMHPTQPDLQFEQTTQKGVDVGLAFHLMRSFSKKAWRKLYLVAGDGDFHEVIQHLVENEDVKVTIFGNRRTVSSEIAPYAQVYYFEDIFHQIAETRPEVVY